MHISTVYVSMFIYVICVIPGTYLHIYMYMFLYSSKNAVRFLSVSNEKCFINPSHLS